MNTRLRWGHDMRWRRCFLPPLPTLATSSGLAGPAPRAPPPPGSHCACTSGIMMAGDAATPGGTRGGGRRVGGRGGNRAPGVSSKTKRSAMRDLTTVEAKAFVPSKDFALCKQFYQDFGFDNELAWSSDDLAYLGNVNSSFLLHKFYNKEHAHNFMMHCLSRTWKLGGGTSRQLNRSGRDRGDDERGPHVGERVAERHAFQEQPLGDQPDMR